MRGIWRSGRTADKSRRTADKSRRTADKSRRTADKGKLSADKGKLSADSTMGFSVVDPGTMTFRLLVVETQDNGATVWGWDQRPGPPTADVDPASLIAFCQEMENQAEAMAQELAGRWILPDQILVGLPASQLRGRASSITQRRAHADRPVEERELRSLLGRALRLAANRLSDQDPGWLLVDAAPTAFTVDGRGVTDPVGFRGEEIGANVFAALARVETIQTWGLVARELEFSTLILVAAPLALAASLAEPQGMLIDVGGATTDLTWWRTGRPVILDTLPTGGMALTRALVEKWSLSPERAERLKQAYASGRLPEDAEAQVLDVLSATLKTWLQDTEAALARMNQDELLPQQVYLFGGGSALPEMMEAARSLAWSQKLRFSRYPQVDRLRPTDVPGVVNRTDQGRGAGDVSALALAAWAAHQTQASDRPTRILSEIWHPQAQNR
jgi:cell division ATPase FtsA